MRKLALLLPLILCMYPNAAQPAVTNTQLVMGAHWDDGTDVIGTVTFGQVNAGSPDTVLANKALSSGWTTILTPLSPNSFYDVTLQSSSGTQLVKFPFVTALINPSNLQRAEIDLIFHKTQNSLASAQVKVSLAF